MSKDFFTDEFRAKVKRHNEYWRFSVSHFLYAPPSVIEAERLRRIRRMAELWGQQGSTVQEQIDHIGKQLQASANQLAASFILVGVAARRAAAAMQMSLSDFELLQDALEEEPEKET